MNTRSIIMFLEDGVEINDECYAEHHTLVLRRQRVYPYDTMTPASYNRFIGLYLRPEAMLVLVGYGRQKKLKVIIYWKRTQGRIWLDEQHAY